MKLVWFHIQEKPSEECTQGNPPMSGYISMTTVANTRARVKRSPKIAKTHFPPQVKVKGRFQTILKLQISHPQVKVNPPPWSRSISFPPQVKVKGGRRFWAISKLQNSLLHPHAKVKVLEGSDWPWRSCRAVSSGSPAPESPRPAPGLCAPTRSRSERWSRPSTAHKTG